MLKHKQTTVTYAINNTDMESEKPQGKKTTAAKQTNKKTTTTTNKQTPKQTNKQQQLNPNI